MRIVYVVGARPNLVKMAPVIAALRKRLPGGRHVLLHTGQHYDHMMSAVFVDALELPEPSYHLGVGPNTHARETAKVMEGLEPILEQERPDLVIVLGDVDSTLASVLVTVKLGIPLAHVESGLRSFDRTMPEEINRIVADEFSDHLFVDCEEGIENLRREGITEERVHFVGNTMIDSLVAMEERFRSLATARRLGLEPGSYLLVTLHRPALAQGPLLMETMAELGDLASEMPVVFPVHPCTRRMLGDGIFDWPGLRLIDPVGYLDFLSLEADAAAVLTDAGGVQEESTYLGVPCFTLRDNTERPGTVRLGTNTLLGLAPERIAEIPELLDQKQGSGGTELPLWDGCAAQRIADVVLQSRGDADGNGFAALHIRDAVATPV